MALGFKQLQVWKTSRALARDVYTLLEKFPKHETYALCDQLRRASVSVCSNIAEGAGRVSSKEKIHFNEVAFGSLMEVACQMILANDFCYISDSELELIEREVEDISKMISGYNKFLKSQIHE